MAYIFNKEKVREEFYELVEAGKVGGIWTGEEFGYVRFNYILNGKLYDQVEDEMYHGIDDNPVDEYEYDDSNGTANFIPTLSVNNEEIFLEKLTNCLNKYSEIYHFKETIKNNEPIVIRNLILILFSNARYVDFANPELYLERTLKYLNDTILQKYNNTIIANDVEELLNSNIVINNKLDVIGYETPYAFEISCQLGDEKFYFPVINYAIADNVCHIYSVQNKNANANNTYQKKIKRVLYKLYDTNQIENNEENLPAPSFIFAMSIFMKILKSNNISNLRIVTFLPDRYFEKKGTGNLEVDKIQNNLTQKLINLFYQEKIIFPNIEINYPLYEGYADEDFGDDLVIKLQDLNLCNNNFLNNIFSQLTISNIDEHTRKF